MNPEPTPPAAPTIAPAPHWTPVATTSTDAPATNDDQWLGRATLRRGIPGLMGTGFVLIGLGLVLICYTYYYGYLNASLWTPGGIRGDYIGSALLLVGLILAAVFAFVPARRPTGLGMDAQTTDLERAAHSTNMQLTMYQVMVGIGTGLTLLGLVLTAYWMRAAYLDNAIGTMALVGRDVPTYAIGAALAGLGFLIAVIAWAKIPPIRRARNLSVVAWLRQGPSVPSGPVGALPSGVTETEIQNLMKRLDGLMAQLPDAAVTEFSKTTEADTYLKLLGS